MDPELLKTAKPSDKFIVNTPPDGGYYSPRGKKDLRLGDVLTASEYSRGHVAVQTATRGMCLCYHIDGQAKPSLIPVKFIKPLRALNGDSLRDIKKGDSFVVTSLPSPLMNDGPSGNPLEIGDVLLAAESGSFYDPVVDEYVLPYRVSGKDKWEMLRARFLGLLSKASDPPPVCKCNVWITGCICGAFAAEQRAKEQERP